jgi:putative ABC transport system substrate-binding protein
MRSQPAFGRLSRRALVGGLAGLGVSAAGLAVVNGRASLTFMAQSAVARIGWCWSGAPVSASQADAFRAGLRDAGWLEAKNLVIDTRFYGDQPQRMPEIAAELFALKPYLLTGGLVPTLTYVKLTDKLPIVMASVPDPVGLGLIASYARPGGNVTGTSRTGDCTPRLKELEFLRELVPALTRLAIVFNPNISAAQTELRNIQSTASALGIDSQAVPITSTDDIEPTLETALARHPQAIQVAVITPEHHPGIVAFAVRHGLPCVGGEVQVAGALLQYLADVVALQYRTGNFYVDRVLRGAKPADLPVEGPAVFNLIVNRTTAKTLGLAIPPQFAAQVTEWID